MRFELAPIAEAGLAAISDYTFERWGIAQAQSYLDSIEQLLRQAANIPGMGPRSTGDRRAHPALSPFQSHIIYCVEADFGVIVLRVLHASQDPNLHL